MKKFLIAILIIITVAIGGGLTWLATLESEYNVKRSIIVDKPVSEVFALVNDYNQWTNWSPWLCMEPDAKVTVSGSGTEEGDVYTWSGKLVGTGEIEHVKIVPNKSIDQDIRFSAPMESQSKVYWMFDAVNDSTTNIIWGMKGEMPFLARFMTKMMEPMIGMDYERGLKMIKDLAEQGFIASKVEIKGVVEASEVFYLGQEKESTMPEIEEKMTSALYAVFDKTQEMNVTPKMALTLYTHFDIFDPVTRFITGGVMDKEYEVSEPFVSGTIPATKAIKVVFTGDYKHIGNAWSAAMSYMYNHKLKQAEGFTGYELYITDPQAEKDPRKWVSEVYIPVE